jgi:hypothetical protein
METKLLFHPKNLDIISVIENDKLLNQQQKKLCKKYYQRILYPVSKIILEMRLNKSFKDELNEDIYVHLNSKILKKLFGTTLNQAKIKVIQLLIRNNIIVRHRSNYQKGKNSYKYKLQENYINEYYKKLIITDNTLASHLINNDKVDTSNKLLSYIFENMKELNIDATKSVNKLTKKINEKLIINNNTISPSSYVGQLSPEVCSEPILPNKKHDICHISEGLNNITHYLSELDDIELSQRNHIIEVINSWYINIRMLSEQDYFMTKSSTSGRIFNNITSLPSELRACLYFNNNNDEITELDIANSQPFLFNILIDDNFYFERDIFGDNYTDVHQYKQLTSNGKLYDHLIDKWNIKMGRKTFKQDFFAKIFFCKLQSNYRYNLSKKFAEDFPNVFALIVKLKEGNYKNLAIQLQKKEADIIIYKIGKRLMDLGIWFVTIHDSILCKKQDLTTCQQIFEEEFRKLNLFPTIKNK